MSAAADFWGEPIYAYTRAQAIEDGQLVDVTGQPDANIAGMPREVGLRYPVALTIAAWDRYVEIPKAAPWQDIAGRLWDVLYMLGQASKRKRGTGACAEILFQFMATPNEGRKSAAVLSTLKAVCGPGDDGAPVLTIMLPDED